MLARPKEINASCILPSNLIINNKFNISCQIKDSTDICPIDSSEDEILIIKQNPDDILSKSIYFKNFTNKTTLIEINAGNISKLSYDQEIQKYHFMFENSTIISSITKNISFNLSIEKNEDETQATCYLNINSSQINCEIENTDSENININIRTNPTIDTESIPEKVINFSNFENKQINTLIAGKIQKGSCINNIYTFNIINSQLQNNFENEFNLELKEPNKISKCAITNFDDENNLCDIKCTLDETTSCESEYEGKDLIIDNKDPEPIRIDDNKIIYFANFNGQNTIVYEIKVGNLLKGIIDQENCLYHFKFNNDPFKLPNFKKDIIFQFNMTYNESLVTANCTLSELNNQNEIENKTVDLNCFFPLDDDICQKGDLLNYDLYIGEDINNSKIIIDSSQEINLVGFDKKETLTLLGKNIKDKYEENDKINFIMDFNSAKQLSDNILFVFNFSKSGNDNIYKLNCSFNIESQKIECTEEDNRITINDDIIIKSTPKYIPLNNQTIYFQNFINKRTYTIKADQIEKLQCASSGHYYFNILNTSCPYIPREAIVEIPVLVNDNEDYIAYCTIKNSANYMDCVINDIDCPENIILNNERIEPNETLFYPNTTFFNDFKNKRTITIKAGKIHKGQCEHSTKYHFTFTENEIDYITDSVIIFNLPTSINSKQYISNCSINLTSEEKIINCFINTCPEADNFILIESNPTPDYKSLYPNSTFFENFINKNISTILMSKSGVIIKQENGFILTDNYLNDKIYSSFSVTIKVNISGEEKDADCLIPEVEKNEIFEITCTVDYYPEENEIEIIEEPINDNYNFSGYKNKRTLTLTGGSLYKNNDNNIFYIYNNTFNGEYPLIDKLGFNLSCRYNDDLERNASCSFNTTQGIIDDKVQINCLTKISDTDIKAISLLNNPTYALMNENVTLYFKRFENLNLYTFTPGDIIKGQCESNSYSFNLINNSLSNPLSQRISLNIPVIINETDPYESSCDIDEQSTFFNMSCKIDNYCPANINIDIKIQKAYISNMSIINPDTLYINISSEIKTSTLNFGFLEKISCSDEGNYLFRINNSYITGKNLENAAGQFNVKIAQFDEIGNCKLNSLNILCSITLNPDNDYCTNINKDIKIEELSSDNNYIITKNNNKILHLYGIQNLETFTVVGGELNQGTYSDKISTFYLNKSKAYNQISSSNNYNFSLSLNTPKNKKAVCSLPLEITQEEEFDINCIINENIKDYIIQTGNEEPKNITYNTQAINFKEFINKKTQVILNAGDIKLGINDNYKYYLNFTNSTIDYDPTSDISFNLPIKLNNIDQNSICYLYQNNKDIKCDFNNTEKTYIKKIIVSNNPENNIELIQGKTITFGDFSNKEVYSFIAGSIEKGSCDSDGNYTFNFRNCSSEKSFINNVFNLQMDKENYVAKCTIIKRETIKNLYNVKCSIKLDDSCTDDKQSDFTVGIYDPNPYILTDKSILYYFNFSRQSTIDNSYRLNGGILSKDSIEVSDDKIKYNFKIENCKLSKPFENDYKFNITINLDIYDDYSNKNYEGKADCIIPNSISDKNNTNIILKCSFDVNDKSIYTDKGNYDISIKEGDKSINIDDDHILYIRDLNGLTTVTIYNCQISKGKCDSSNKYTYTFSSCTIPKDISIVDFQFTLETNKREKSTCKFISKTIECEINEYSLCSENEDIIIGDDEAFINYTQYSSYKNLYIIGLKNLYTSSLNGGTMNFGECQSNDYIFYFNHTKLTNQLSEVVNIKLSIIEPSEMNYQCIIPLETNEFDLKCIIKGESGCPITDPTLLKIKEITSENRTNYINPNGLYINNFINKNIVNLQAGTMTQGQCNSNNYEFYFVNSYISGGLKSELKNDAVFTLNLKYPNYLKANCILPEGTKNNTNLNIKCTIEGSDRCPMFYYTYFEIEENEPSVNESIISPYVLKFSNFKNQKISFDHYYLRAQGSRWECQGDMYNFNLSATFLVNVTESESFRINVSNDTANITYNCNFSKGIVARSSGTITCFMDKQILLENSNLTVNFDIIYLEGKNKYIINNSTNKKFAKNNVECPYFHIDDSSSTSPTKNSTDNSMIYSIIMDTSLKDKQIKVYDSDQKEKEALEVKLKPVTSSKYFYKFLYLTDDIEFSSICNVPKNTNISLQINCTGYNITDTSSEYFYSQSSDKIDIGGYQFGVNNTQFKNPFKQDDNTDNTDSTEGDSISTAGKVVLIIFIILVIVAIILAILYYFCFYRKKIRETNTSNNNNNPQNSEERPMKNNNNNDNNRNQSNNTGNNENENDEEDEDDDDDDDDDEEENENSGGNNNSNNRHIDNKEQTFEYK